MILLRECHNDILGLACGDADELLFESRDKCAGTDSEALTLGCAAIKSDAVYCSGVIKVDRIAVSYRSVCDIYLAGILLLLALKLFFDILVSDCDILLGNFNCHIVAELDFRLDSYFHCVNEVLALLHLHRHDFRISDNIEFCFIDSVRIGLVYAFICSILIEDARSVHFLNDVLRSFAFTESRDVETAFCFVVSRCDCLIKVSCRYCDRQCCHAVLNLFDLYAHIFIVPPRKSDHVVFIHISTDI